jgi:hypothetical protein
MEVKMARLTIAEEYLTKCGGFAYTVSQGVIGEERFAYRELCEMDLTNIRIMLHN